MILPTLSVERRSGRLLAACVRIALLVALVIGSSILSGRPASASVVLEAAAQTANAGLDACASNRGKELYNCVANVLDRMSSDIARIDSAQTRSALQTAATRLRAAVTKAQALSAITQCRSVIAGALRQVKAAGNRMISGWGDSGLSAIAGVLARAAQLIQSKG